MKVDYIDLWDLFFEGWDFGIVATSKEKGNSFFSNSLFFEWEKNANFFEVKILLGAKTLPHFH
jgi:hypothetical protein